MQRPPCEAALLDETNVENRTKSSRLQTQDRQRKRAFAQRPGRPPCCDFLLPQSQHSRLNHRSVRVSRRKEGLRQAERSDPRRERRLSSGPGEIQEQAETELRPAQRSYPQDGRELRRLAPQKIPEP